MNWHDVQRLTETNRAGKRHGLPSFCTANRMVLEAVFEYAAPRSLPVLVEATCNQVNQFGGYTDMKASDYRELIHDISREYGYDPDAVLLGGDHLGPNPWKDLQAEEAMKHAEELVRSYADAGYRKIHLDASMGCKGEGPLPPVKIAERAARLCAVAETTAAEAGSIFYIVGTEVPVPGGETDDMEGLQITAVSNLGETVSTHQDAFSRYGLEDAWSRVCAIVTQPGVDFSHSSIHGFDEVAAKPLTDGILDYPGLAYEAHSTDYQTSEALQGMVNGHYVFLKVGPELTFAFREAIMALAHMETHLIPVDELSLVVEALKTAMDDDPAHWRQYYIGDDQTKSVQKLFSYSDRIRYYWSVPPVVTAVKKLFANLRKADIPQMMISQYFPLSSSNVYCTNMPRVLCIEHIQRVVKRYYDACGY